MPRPYMETHMAKTITEQNLRTLVDALIKDGKRVVGPKQGGTTVLYEPLAKGDELTLGTLPRRSAKEAFFPVSEPLLTFEKDKEGVRVADVDTKSFPETVLVGVLPCDAAAPGILDAVFSWDYHDAFFLERRQKTTIVGLACTKADDACFCTLVGFSPTETKGSDLFLTPLEGGGYQASAITDKGEKLLAAYPQLFDEVANVKPVPPAAPEGEKVDLQKVKAWLEGHFEDPLWEEIATRCAGCGACAFLCPACHCFDIVDEGTQMQGTRRKNWDACGFGKFTNHASGHNPRDVQNKRYRNRVMHKFKYYDDKFGQTLCTGCGRCVRACPVGIDIKAVLDEINKG
jgi:ferredoxin